MLKKLGGFTLALAMAISLFLPGGCKSVNDEVIPSMPVSINLASHDLWNTYGVAGYGNYRIFNRELRIPLNFAYNDRTYTGYGGVLLISGVNPFTLEAGVPLAYDLSCPVERKPDIRVQVVEDGLVPQAVCPKCGSHYDILERGGSPVEGVAVSENVGLRRYECREGLYGGYLIIN